MTSSATVSSINRLGRRYRNAAAFVIVGLVGIVAPAGAEILPPDLIIEPVVITRDSRGEPHIAALSSDGASYGFAWAQMEDQAGYILTAIARANGKSAALAGVECDADGNVEKCFREDQLAHLFRVPQDAFNNFNTPKKLRAADKSRFEAFAKGINDYIKRYQGKPGSNVPAWAVEVDAHEILAFVQYGFIGPQIDQAMALMQAELKDKLTDKTLCATDTFASAAPAMERLASNMFALSGKNTASGDPILQGDPHLPFGVPGTPQSVMWYSARITYPGHDVSGITFRGTPGIAIGRNASIAWTMTANHNSQHEVDVYRELLDGTDGPDENLLIDNYLYEEKPYLFQRERVDVGFKDANGNLHTVKVYFRRSAHHGPVISDCLARASDGSQPVSALEKLPKPIAYSARVSQYGQYGLSSQLWRMAGSKSVAEFKQAMEPVQLSGFNVLAVDNVKTVDNPHGNVFFVAASRSGRMAPCLTAPDCDFNTVLDGWVKETNWLGILRFDELPQVTNPASGFVFNANNAPFYSAPEIRESELNFVLQGGNNTTRSMRLVQLLAYDDGDNVYEAGETPRRGIDVDDVRTIGMDTFIVTAPGLQRLMTEAARAPGASARVKEAAALFGAWDGWARARSTALNPGPIAYAYPAFATWKRQLEKRERRLKQLSFDLNTPVGPEHAFTATDLAEARRAAEVIFRDSSGALPLSLDPGTVHHFDLPSPDAFSEPVNGADEDLATVRMTNCKSLRTESALNYVDCPITGGSSHIWLYDFDTGTMQVSRPMADTANPESEFYTLNAYDYVNDLYRTFPLSAAQLNAEKTSRITIFYRPQ